MEGLAGELGSFFNKSWGRRATRYLREESVFKLMIGKEPHVLRKSGGKMEVVAGEPENYDVLFEISSNGIRYLSDAKSEQECEERLQVMANAPTSDHYMRMRIDMEPTEQNRLDFYWKGYFFWARRMAFTI